MADISRITLPGGTTYDIKDATARTQIANIQNAMTGEVKPLGTTTTVLTDESTTNPIVINGSNITAVTGNLVYYNKKEFIFDGTKWIELGDLSSIGDLGYKDSASGSFTPTGTVSKPSFTGTAMNSTGSYTPAGDVSLSKGTTDVVVKPKAVSGQSPTYTPEGTVTPNITLSTTTVNSITAVGTLPSCTLPKMTTSVLEETLTLGWSDGSFSAGTLPTKGSNQTVATGVSEASATFSGTGARLVAESVQTVNSASFSGTAATISVSGTPTGDVSQPTFTGKAGTVTVS